MLTSSNNPAEEYQQNKDLYCYDLLSTRQPEVERVLVTGASGYIGGRLVPELMARGYKVRVMVRAASPIYEKRWPGAEIMVADALCEDSLKAALKDVHTAYYLIHSLLLGPEKFAIADLQAAANFRKAAESSNVSRIIYLGGLGDTQKILSNHLQSRMKVADELCRGKVPVTVLRAAIIIGSGSASYEIIEHLVKNTFIILIPHWAKNKCQPIAIRDVIKYLVGVLETPETIGKLLDIGSIDILTYEEMLKIMAHLLGKKRIFLPVPFSNIRFFSYFASLLTPVPAPITMCLMEGLTNQVVCQNRTARQLIPINLLTYRQAIVKAMSREEQDQVHTRWSDAYPHAHELAVKLHELVKPPEYIASYSIDTVKSPSSLFNSVCKIGGRKGWFYQNWMWRMRGGIDRILLGVGSIRGRKRYSNLEVNDVVDFWRVEDIQLNRKLLLRAEMKLPGKAWLEFNIQPKELSSTISINAYFHTKTLFGHLYWFLFIPFHRLIFVNLLKHIVERS